LPEPKGRKAAEPPASGHKVCGVPSVEYSIHPAFEHLSHLVSRLNRPSDLSRPSYIFPSRPFAVSVAQYLTDLKKEALICPGLFTNEGAQKRRVSLPLKRR